MARAHAYGSGRGRLLDAARATFAEKGYRGATTKEIAERAGMTEAMIFRHFGSKAVLFQDAAVSPIVSFMEAYVADWQTRDHGVTDAESEATRFFVGLAQAMSVDRALLLSILAAGEFDEEVRVAASHVTDAFARVIADFEALIRTEFGLRGLRATDEPALARMLVGMLISAALHPEWLRIGEGPGEVALDRVVIEAARVIVEGVRPR